MAALRSRVVRAPWITPQTRASPCHQQPRLPSIPNLQQPDFHWHFAWPCSRDIGLGNVDNTTDASKPVSSLHSLCAAQPSQLSSLALAGITKAMLALTNVHDPSDADRPAYTTTQTMLGARRKALTIASALKLSRLVASAAIPRHILTYGYTPCAATLENHGLRTVSGCLLVLQLHRE